MYINLLLFDSCSWYECLDLTLLNEYVVFNVEETNN